jgi:Putative Flp pilus-assembly TadE/G-like
MIGLIRKLWGDRRGNVLAIAAACMPLVVGAAGLATDTIQWTLWRRQLQRAADSAAIAGVYDRSAASGATTNTPSAVCYDLGKNVHTWMTLKDTSPCTGTVGSYSSISYPANNAFVINQVTVDLRVQQSLPFSSMFVSTAPIITASATAGSVSAGGTACMQALESSTSTPGITNNGNTTVKAPTCILYSNSPAANAASAGGSSSVTAKAIAAVGGISQSNNWHVSQYIPYSPPLPDPFGTVNVNYADMHCTGAALNKNTNLSAASLGITNCFSSLDTQPSDSIDLTGTPLDGKTVYINSGGVDLKGDFKCTCTIVLTNNDPSSSATIGSYDSNSQAHNNITAPTTGNYAGIAIYQDRRASTGSNNTVNGGSGNIIKGAVYFPNSILKINGTGDVASDGSSLKLCAMWVAKDINLIGTSSIAINAPDDSACVGSGLPSGGSVRQVRVLS